MTQNAQEVLEQAIPDRHEVLAAYLYYVMDQQRSAVGAAALKLAHLHDGSDVLELETACDLLIDAGKFAEARDLWQRMGHTQIGLIDNGDFATAPSGHGFDWRPSPAEGVAYLPLPGSYRIVFSGKQPESSELLRHFVALNPGKVYSLRWEARTQGFASPSGIDWTAGVTYAALDAAQDWRASSMDFKAETAFLPITLAYHRPTGQARAEGSVEIRAVSLVEKQPNR
jgi:hypothetical protein